jgi:hypothetical protein
VVHSGESFHWLTVGMMAAPLERRSPVVGIMARHYALVAWGS